MPILKREPKLKKAKTDWSKQESLADFVEEKQKFESEVADQGTGSAKRMVERLKGERKQGMPIADYERDNMVGAIQKSKLDEEAKSKLIKMWKKKSVGTKK